MQAVSAEVVPGTPLGRILAVSGPAVMPFRALRTMSLNSFSAGLFEDDLTAGGNNNDEDALS
jgi:hypothetical protein